MKLALLSVYKDWVAAFSGLVETAMANRTGGFACLRRTTYRNLSQSYRVLEILDGRSNLHPRVQRSRKDQMSTPALEQIGAVCRSVAVNLYPFKQCTGSKCHRRAGCREHRHINLLRAARRIMPVLWCQ